MKKKLYRRLMSSQLAASLVVFLNKLRNRVDVLAVIS